MCSPRSEWKRSFSARYSLADADSGSESMSEMEEESKVRQQCFCKVALIILLAQNNTFFFCHRDAVHTELRKDFRLAVRLNYEIAA